MAIVTGPLSHTATGNFTSKGAGDTIAKEFQVDYESLTDDPLAVVIAAQTASTNPLPLPRQQYSAGSALFADTINVKQNDINRQIWDATVTWSAPEGGSTSEADLHPLLRNPRFSLQFVEKEHVVQSAENLEGFTGTGYTRAANTEGPIANGLNQETGEPMLDTVWNGIIQVRRFVPDLYWVLNFNKTYQLTTNSDTVLGQFPPRTLKYQVTQGSEEMEQDDLSYYEMTTSIEILPTTDRTINSVGWKYLNSDNKVVRAVDDEGEPAGEPVFVGLDGKKSTDPVEITYRYLKPTQYSFLVQ